MAQENWKGPLGREYWENKAEQAWTDLGKPKPNLSPSNPTQNDLDYDAFRHAYTSAQWTRQVGEDAARAGGDYIEQSNSRNFSSEKGQRDMRGDLINNKKGRDIGKNAPSDWSDKRLAEEVADALKRGDLVTDKQTEARTLPENFPQDLNPKKWKDIADDALSDDVMLGGDANDAISAGAGDDVLLGRGRTDTLSEGHDVLDFKVCMSKKFTTSLQMVAASGLSA